MSSTLFRYIFKDLLRIFLLTSGALAGIMSFGGLLRPLTEHGLDAAQAGKMLSYFMPAMTTYSLPIAALFATTVVYGRLAADNELVACRAAGLSFFSVGMPALVLGLLVAIFSLLFLCFIVPVFSLKVERVIYSNLAQLIANQIERTHQIIMDDTTIFAQSAEVAADDPNNPDEQMVRLAGLMIVTYNETEAANKETDKLKVPREIYLAKEAIVSIRRSKHDNFTLDAELRDGAMFPRQFIGTQSTQGGIAQTRFGPKVMESLISEKTKFMDIRRLHELSRDLGKSRRVQEQVQSIVRQVQESTYLRGLTEHLQEPGARYRFDAGGEQYELIAPSGGATMRGGRLAIAPAQLIQTSKTSTTPSFIWDAAEIELRAQPVADDNLAIQATLHNVTVDTPEGPTAHNNFARHLTVAMPEPLKALAKHDAAYYLNVEGVSSLDRMALQRQLLRIGNGIQSEMHSRVSFALACLFLVIVGCALGTMFKSGNFLSAFAVSVVPALACISLVVAGHQTATNIPWRIDANFKDPLRLGLALIWSGNVATLAIAVVLLWKVCRR